LLELCEGAFEFQDNDTHQITGRQRLFPSGVRTSGTMLAGKRVQR